MEALQSWVMQIILFILLAFVLDMVLPDTDIRKYVKLVMGLMLLLLFLKPVFALFQVDSTRAVQEAMEGFAALTEAPSIENSIEEKKSEIDSIQRAYIEEQMAVQLKDQANPTLQEKFHMQITDIAVAFKEGEDEETTEAIDSIQVKVQSTDQELPEGKISDVDIDSSRPIEANEQTEDMGRVKSYLAEIWELEDLPLEVTQKGGTG
ncbi:stage III sporulation protein AF [Terribacillus saccharophilus]|uniref:Stage III sporulation protein AF n=1 Tax=Terribacillus saccharophilus TaxID=361277 RepID=A0A268ADI7_9BACI|nr:stage III sporulation protein AF [Terribacillus saccharophilus]PAD22179.1 stage III sporulation protein AF [Terribacillus saccharophilus]PAF19347.1 stage III sporulation protein AF [Terribacillus saccharophilus]PAF22598.1 stage III sporulation protein AF [Terribacillus saccharophilus]PAF38787.1 stage III sporulation protein AF [Terribacillus saccharophilus]PAF40872.1 stage III sporulation protein AF [Terribacillus saccharophilus]